jgi:hypothetical protein
VKALEFKIEKKKPFFGAAPYGNARIEAQDVKTVAFQGKVAKKK